jgi:hypothetical protein
VVRVYGVAGTARTKKFVYTYHLSTHGTFPGHLIKDVTTWKCGNYETPHHAVFCILHVLPVIAPKFPVQVVRYLYVKLSVLNLWLDA